MGFLIVTTNTSCTEKRINTYDLNIKKFTMSTVKNPLPFQISPLRLSVSCMGPSGSVKAASSSVTHSFQNPNTMTLTVSMIKRPTLERSFP